MNHVSLKNFKTLKHCSSQAKSWSFPVVRSDDISQPSLLKTCPNGVSSGPYFPVFSPNTRKYGPEKIRIWTHFMQCLWSTTVPTNVNFLICTWLSLSKIWNLSKTHPCCFYDMISLSSDTTVQTCFEK